MKTTSKPSVSHYGPRRHTAYVVRPVRHNGAILSKCGPDLGLISEVKEFLKDQERAASADQIQ
jgi:hypothetical protein